MNADQGRRIAIAAQWREQCDAASRLRYGFGLETTLEYLLREKFFGFLRVA